MLRFLSLCRGDIMTLKNLKDTKNLKRAKNMKCVKGMKNLLGNDDAVAVSVGFILMFGITVLVFSTLTLSFYDLSRQSEKTAMRNTFEIMGQRIAIEMTTADSMVNYINSFGGTVNSIEYEFTLPASIATNTYSINFTNSTNDIALESDNGARVAIPFNISNNLSDIELYSGAEVYKFGYDKNYGNINIEER